MSESREKKRRYYQRMDYIRKFEDWLASEPPMIMFWAWRKWKKSRPVLKDCDWESGALYQYYF